jgi:hypothetical protein
MPKQTRKSHNKPRRTRSATAREAAKSRDEHKASMPKQTKKTANKPRRTRSAAREAAKSREEQKASPAEVRREYYWVCRGLDTEPHVRVDVPASSGLDDVIDVLTDPNVWDPDSWLNEEFPDAEIEPRRDLTIWHNDRIVAAVKVNAESDGFNVTRFDSL